MKTTIMATMIGALALTGCLSTNSYVDPKFSAIDYTDITAVDGNAVVFVEFQRNGKPFKRAQKVAETAVVQALENAGYTVVEDGTDGPVIKVVVNNVADIGQAAGQGFGTGLTLGLAGTAVSDFYEISASYSDGTVTFEQDYEHAIHTTIGNKKAPIENVAATNPQNAFDAVIEDVILQFLSDVQASQAGTPVAQAVFVPRYAG